MVLEKLQEDSPRILHLGILKFHSGTNVVFLMKNSTAQTPSITVTLCSEDVAHLHPVYKSHSIFKVE